MPDVDSLERHPAFCFYSLAIENRQSTFENSFGGIAQLVERQLCKLEVRGSNPLASSLRWRRQTIAQAVAPWPLPKADILVLHFRFAFCDCRFK